MLLMNAKVWSVIISNASTTFGVGFCACCKPATEIVLAAGVLNPNRIRLCQWGSVTLVHQQGMQRNSLLIRPNKHLLVNVMFPINGQIKGLVKAPHTTIAPNAA